MIKLKNLIDGTTRNPFTGELYEGLIYSVDTKKANEFLIDAGFDVRNVITDSLIVKIECWHKEKDNEIYFASALFEKKFSKLYKLINNLGYFVAEIRTGFVSDDFESAKKHIVKSESDIRNVVKERRPEIVYFTFQKKYDNLFNENLPKFLYHVTDDKFLPSIKKIGLKPVAGSKKGYHPERVYFALTENYASEMWKDFNGWHIDENSGILIKIDTNKLQKNTNFYIDPNFKNKGVYTYNNIPKQAVVSIEKYIS